MTVTPLKTLLMGGSNFLGLFVAEELRQRGHEVTLLTRGNSPLPAGFDSVTGDRGDVGFLSEVADRNFDVVIDNLAYGAEDVNRAATAFRGRTGRWVITSSAAVYLASGEPPFAEESAPVDPRDADLSDSRYEDYVMGKLEAEWSAIHSDLPGLALVRPPVIIGRHDPTLRLHYYVERVMDGEPILLHGGGEHAFSLAAVDDVAEVIVRLAEGDGAEEPQIFNVAQPDAVTQRDMIGWIGEALGREPELVEVSGEDLAEAGFEYLDPMGPDEPFHDGFVVSVERLREKLGFVGKPVKRAVIEAAEWHAAHTAMWARGRASRDGEIELARRVLARGGDE